MRAPRIKTISEALLIRHDTKFVEIIIIIVWSMKAFKIVLSKEPRMQFEVFENTRAHFFQLLDDEQKYYQLIKNVKKC